MNEGVHGRQCGSCTMCCSGWINATINEQKLRPGKACEHCVEEGCAIYENRPVVPCASFKCGWLADQSPLPEHMNPVESGAIILFDRRWHGMPCVFALPTGSSVPRDTLEWLMSYSRKNNIPLIFMENTFENGKFIEKKETGYGPPVFIQAVRNAIKTEDVFMF